MDDHLAYKARERDWWFDSFKKPRKWNDDSNIKKEEEWNNEMAKVPAKDHGMPKKYTDFSPENINSEKKNEDKFMRFSEIVELMERQDIKLTKDSQKEKMGKVMKEFKEGKLHSGTGKEGEKGPVVTDRKQAIAIALNVASQK